jgi:hypothetical protein
LGCERPRCVKSFLDSDKYRNRAILAEKELDNMKKKFKDLVIELDNMKKKFQNLGISGHFKVESQKMVPNANLSKDDQSSSNIIFSRLNEVSGISPGKT